MGTKVKIQISDSNEIRIDPSLPGEAAIISTMDLSDQIAEASAAFGQHRYPPHFEETASKPSFGSYSKLHDDQNLIQFSVAGGAGVGTPAQSSNSLALVLMLLRNEPDATSVVMTGPDGRQVDLGRDEISELAHAMRSADPAARKTAIDKWHQLRARVTGPAVAQPAHGPASDQGGGTVKDRLAKLDALLSEGVLTQSEYDAQRQRIISEI